MRRRRVRRPRRRRFSPIFADGGAADAVASRPALAAAAASGARAEFLALRLLPRALVTGSIVALVSLTRRRDGAILKAVAKEAAALEAAYLRGLHRGTFSCRWRADAYEAPGERNKTSEDKALTNAAVAAAAMRSALDRGVPPSECPSLVLDAADARTSAALASARATRDPRGPRDGRRSRGTAGDEEFDGEAVAYEDKWEGERVLVSAEFREGSLDVEFEPSARGEDAAARGGDEGGEEDAARDGDEAGRDEFLRGFPPEAIFVPNHHTHVVRSLRGGEAGVTGPIRSPRGRSCAAFAADVRDVLASAPPRRAGVPPRLPGPLRRGRAEGTADLGRLLAPRRVRRGGARRDVQHARETPRVVQSRRRRDVREGPGGGGGRARVRAGGGRRRRGGDAPRSRARTCAENSWTTPCASREAEAEGPR